MQTPQFQDGGRYCTAVQHVVTGSEQMVEVLRTLRRQGQDVAPARVIVFCEDEAAARGAAMPLRSGLWGEHTVSVLLPHGEEPIQVMSWPQG